MNVAHKESAASSRAPALVMLRPRAVLVGLCALSVAYSAFLSWSFAFNNVDDAYIAFRYAWHFAHGHGLVFNPGERVEGYTSPLWTVLMAPWTRFDVDIVWWSIALGLLASLATLWGLLMHTRFLIASGVGRWIVFAPLLLVCDNSHAFWAVGGMEMPLFCALFVWGVYWALADESPRASWRCGVVFGLATLTRPEGALLFAVVVAHRLAVRRRPALAGVAWMALGFAILVVTHLVWRRWYYGVWLPNTFHNKVTIEAAAMATGAGYVFRFILWRYGVPLLALAGRRDPNAARPLGLYRSLVLVYTAYVAAIGGDWFVANRFMVPALPFVYLLVVHALLAWVQSRRLRAGVLTILVGAVAVGSFLHAESWGLVRRNQNVVVETQRKRFGHWLRAAVPAGTLIAVGPAGAIPYYSRLPALDMWGLTDAHIARMPRSRFQPGHDRTDLAYVVSRRPALIVGAVGFDARRPPHGYTLMTEIPAVVRPAEPVFGLSNAVPPGLP